MKTIISITTIICLALFLATNVVKSDKICSSPPYARNGQWAGVNKECAALVQSKCPGVGHTTTWRRGTRVKGNCGGSIQRYSAIATFEGPNNTYNTPPDYKNQHTAIFVSCDATGITVYDQYRKSGGVKQRVLRYGGRGVNNGDLYYTIQ